MGPGSHVGFPISAKDNNLVYDHPMNISAKFVDRKFNMAARANNVFCLVETLKIFLSETTKPIEL
jgi:UDP-N-acetylglucosamine transferase subunit ALG13